MGNGDLGGPLTAKPHADFLRQVTEGVRAAARAEAGKDPETLAREMKRAEEDSWLCGT